MSNKCVVCGSKNRKFIEARILNRVNTNESLLEISKGFISISEDSITRHAANHMQNRANRAMSANVSAIPVSNDDMLKTAGDAYNDAVFEKDDSRAISALKLYVEVRKMIAAEADEAIRKGESKDGIEYDLSDSDPIPKRGIHLQEGEVAALKEGQPPLIIKGPEAAALLKAQEDTMNEWPPKHRIVLPNSTVIEPVQEGPRNSNAFPAPEDCEMPLDEGWRRMAGLPTDSQLMAHRLKSLDMKTVQALTDAAAGRSPRA